MSHKIIYLDDSIGIADLMHALRFSPFCISNTVVPNAFVLRPNPRMLTDTQFQNVISLFKDKHERQP